QVVQQSKATRFPATLLVNLDSAKLDSGTPRSFCRWHTGSNQVARVGCDVKRHLIRHRAFHALPPQEAGDERAEPRNQRHNSSGTALRKAAIMSPCRFQLSVSSRNWRFPLAHVADRPIA